MTVISPEAAVAETAPSDPVRRRPTRMDLIAVSIFVLGAGYITMRLWLDLANRITSSNTQDYAFFQFAFAHAAHSVAAWDNPLFSSVLNAPHGVNMMANTSMLGLTIPLAPVTLLWGPKVSFAIALVIALAATATTWYLFFLRHITRHPLIALVAAGVCGFAPGMVSHSNAHPNIVAQFMVPLILSRVLRLRDEPARAARHGLILGLMIVYQTFINEEILLYTAFACALMVFTFVMSRPREARELVRPYLVGIGIAAALAGVLLAYPLWFQFFGPGHYHGPFEWARVFGLDAITFVETSSESLFGRDDVAGRFATPTEQNSFYGWGMCLFAVVFAVAFRRVLAVRVAAVIGVALGALSLGNDIKINGRLGVPGPWRAISHLPLMDSIIVSRLAMGVAVAMAVVLAVAADRLLPQLAKPVPQPRPDGAPQSEPVKTALRPALLATAVAALALILLPIVPTPLPTENQPQPPAFFTDGAWQRYVSGGAVLPVPPGQKNLDTMHWLVAAEMKMKVVDGYFIGPTSETDALAAFGGPKQPTGDLLTKIADSGQRPLVTEADKRQAVTDIRYWNVDAIVLAPQKNEQQLRSTLDELTGRTGSQIGGVWVWDVRDIST